MSNGVDLTPGNTNQFEMVYHGPVNWNELGTNMNRTVLIREYLAWPTPDGRWGKVYGFADGHTETHFEPDGDFTSWQKHFQIPNASQ